VQREFRRHRDVPPTEIYAIEHLIRMGSKKLEAYSSDCVYKINE
jgi:hypothetical protein